MKECIASLVVYRAPWRFTSTVLRLGGFEGYSGPDGSGISFDGDMVNEGCCTVVREYFVIDGNSSIGDNMIDGARGCHRGRCAEEIDLVVPVHNVAADEFDAYNRQYACGCQCLDTLLTPVTRI